MKSNTDSCLPSPKDLQTWLELANPQSIEDLIDKSLLSPLVEFLARPSKNFRSHLVALAFQLVGRKSEAEPFVEDAKKILEAIHAASLVVDDIQDGSEFRRGKPTLHRTHGLAVALNSANWLYFWPIEQIQSWGLPPASKLKLTHACHRALIKAHAGQALDVGTPMSQIPKSRVHSVCIASLELKTGALTALAMELGAILAGASEEETRRLVSFGQEFGIALQMFDDLGNVAAKATQDPKRFEDLKGERPSWIWASAAEYLSETDYVQFVDVVKTLPEEGPISLYFKNAPWLHKAKAEALGFLDGALNKLDQNPWDSHALDELRRLVQELKVAYG